LENDAAIEIEMLRRKEQADYEARVAAQNKTEQLYSMKNDV